MTRLLPLFALLVACGEPADSATGITLPTTGETGEGVCAVLSETDITLDEEAGSPLFFSAQNALDELSTGTNTTNVLMWPSGISEGLEISFTHDGGTPTMIEREAQGQLPASELAACFTAIAIPGTLSFVAADGTFDESVSVTLEASKRKEGAVVFTIEQAALSGTWTPEDSDLDAGLTGLTLQFDGEITSLGSEGGITGVESDGTEHAVATWAPPPTQG